MEAEPRRWAATYTKHLKQKRKVYHDGALLLHPESGRLVLLDDAGDTLESRFLRASEEVSAGAALSFHSYLVDVGEPEACPAGSHSSSSTAPAARIAHRGGARARRPSAAGRLNPRVPRAFVNPPIESGKKCIFPNYLTEICEAKNEKEGIHTSGKPMMQTGAMNGSNTSNKMGLNSVSKSKKFISPQNFHVFDTESEVTASSGKLETGKAEMVASGSSGSFMGTGSFKEWNALYTTQLTQKAKKYHDGVIRLIVGSHARQIVLLDEDGGVLGSRYLKSVESVESGTKCHIPNYLIEVSELRNQKNEGKHSLEEVSQTGPKSEDNTSDRTGAKSKSPKFVSPFKSQDARKRNCESTTSSNRPLVGKTICNDMNSHVLLDKHSDSGKSDSNVNGRTYHCKSTFSITDNPLKLNDIQRGTSTNSVWPEVDKSWSSNIGDPLKFHDLRDGKSRCPTNFIRKEVGKSTFGNVDDSIRTASEILSIMKPSSEIKLPQSAPSGPAQSLVSSNSRIPFDASHTNNLVVNDSNRTFDGRGHSGLSHFATQLRTSVQSCLSLYASHTNNLVIDDSNKTFECSGHSGLAHFATQLRTSVQSCLSLETPQRKNSVMAHQWNESSGNSYPTQDIMRPAAFESQDLAMVDILASDISNAKEKKADSSNHHMGSSNDTVPSDPGLQDEKSGTADQLSTESSIVDRRCDAPLSTSVYTLTCKDPKIQELIDDCPSFDLGFLAEGF